MKSSVELHIEPLAGHPQICVLRDRQGRSMGTGSREVLEVLLYIAQRNGESSESHLPQNKPVVDDGVALSFSPGFSPVPSRRRN